MTDLPPNLSDDEMGELKASIMAELGAISPELPESGSIAPSSRGDPSKKGAPIAAAAASLSSITTWA